MNRIHESGDRLKPSPLRLPGFDGFVSRESERDNGCLGFCGQPWAGLKFPYPVPMDYEELPCQAWIQSFSGPSASRRTR